MSAKADRQGGMKMKRRVLAGILTVGMAVVIAGCGGNGGSDSGGNDKGSDAGVISTTATVADEKGNYVVNGSFEEPDFTGWTVNNVDNVTEELDIYTRDTDCYDGVQSLHFYSGTNDVNFTAEQTLTGLEDGSYKLTGYIQGDTAGDANSSVYFYAVVNGETVKADAALKGYVNWDAVEISGLNVSGGEITIGVNVTNAAGGWGTIDAISLVKE